MTSEPPRNPAGHSGFLENLLALASALTEFFETRLALVAQESKAALVQLLVLASCLILALLLFARDRMTKPLFRATASELKKDREWLKNLDTTNQSTS